MGNFCMKKNKIHCSIDNNEFDKLSTEHTELQDKYLKLKKIYKNLENEHKELEKEHKELEKEHKELVESLTDNYVFVKTSENKKKVF